MTKNIMGEKEVQNRKWLESLQAQINPKPSEEEREALKASYLRNRENLKASIQGWEAVSVAAKVQQTIDWGVAMLGAPALWKKTKGENIKVAILDTGIDLRHPDLAANIKGGVNFTTSNPNDYQDRNGHGKQVA